MGPQEIRARLGLAYRLQISHQFLESHRSAQPIRRTQLLAKLHSTTRQLVRYLRTRADRPRPTRRIIALASHPLDPTTPSLGRTSRTGTLERRTDNALFNRLGRRESPIDHPHLPRSRIPFHPRSAHPQPRFGNRRRRKQNQKSWTPSPQSFCE